jgi:hypothetical protein
VPRACAHTAVYLAPPWELPRRDAACRPALYCRGHLVRPRFPGVVGTAKAALPDVALAHHPDDPAARYSDDIVAVLRHSGACLAAHRDALARNLEEAHRGADNVAKSKVRQQDVRRPALLPQDVLPRARFPLLPPAAAASPVLGQQVQRRHVQPWLKLEMLVLLPRVSRRRAPHWSRASPDEWPLRPAL